MNIHEYANALVCGAGVKIYNFTSHDIVNGMPHVFNFCFTDAGECINDVLTILSRCECCISSLPK